MKTFNIHEAKTHLSRLVEAAAKGEPFIIAKAWKAAGQSDSDRSAGSAEAVRFHEGSIHRARRF